jgi:hypothetical protein
MDEPPEFIVWKGFSRPERAVIQEMLNRMGATYEEMKIDIPYLPCENRPDPWYHKYRSVPPDFRLRIWALERG